MSGACLLVFAAAATAAQAQGNGIEERIRRLEIQEEEVQAPAFGIWMNPDVQFKSADERFEATIGAFVIAHSTFAIRENAPADTFSVAETGLRVAATIDGAWEVALQARILPDGADLYLGTVSFVKWDGLILSAGVITSPYSMELQEYNQWIDIPVYSMMSLTTPDIDLGATAEGSLFTETLNYTIGIFNGNGAGAGRDENSDKDACGRLVLRPFAAGGPEILNRLWIGASAMAGRSRHDPGETPFTFETTSTGTAWLVAPAGPPAFRVDGGIRRLGGEIAWLPGPFEFKAEISHMEARIEFDGDAERWNAQSWYVSAGFWLGGSREPGERPDVETPLFAGGWGALQAVARYTQMRVGDEFTNDAGFIGTNRVREYAAAVNWYPNAIVRISLMYALVEYVGDRVPLGGHMIDDEDVLILRTQIDF